MANYNDYQATRYLPIADLPFVGIVINDLFQDSEAHYQLVQAARKNSGRCSDDIVRSTMEFLIVRTEYIMFYKQQLKFWQEQVSEEQQKEIERINNMLDKINKLNKEIVTVAEALKALLDEWPVKLV